ncbi:hypothetical protein [Bradyrhizobium sp. CCBAU 53421]|uniref:hypothetical protein n=1 Tax=Bradyrhizobium sp. CCBAU 53421 TaxID=1325120 RepID=UPI001FEEE24B|nr:hypothetical protein [Bradyrhizobium sp. CCBAU 53421]
MRLTAWHVVPRKALLRPNAGIVLPLVIALEVFPMRPAIRHLLIHVAIAASVLARPANALAEPKLEMHRAGVSADDGSGWHLAVSSKGSFSVLLPIPFNDFTTRDAQTGEVTHVVGGKSSEGIKFVAVELPPGSKPVPDLASIPKTLAADPANKVSDVVRRTSGDAEILALTVSDGGKTMYMRCIDAKGTRYTLTIEFPNAYRDLIVASKDRFFESFKLKTKS